MTAPRIRVVYLAHAFMVGGAEEMVRNLARRLPRRFEPLVCAISEAGPIGDELRRSGIPFTVLHLNPGLRRPLDVNGIRRYLRATRPQIVHTFLLTASLYGRLAAILARVPIVIGTEVNIYERKRAGHIIAERLLMYGTDRVIASAESVRRFYVRQVHADPEKVDVIYNAVDFTEGQATVSKAQARASIGVPSGALVAGIIARLTEQKGHRFLFDAIAARPELSNLHVIIVGGGELGDRLAAQVDALGLTARVHFLGPRRDLGNLLAAMDLFVMPSLWEGLPLSLVLAMGAGLPVIASAVAGIPEVIAHDRTGLLVPPAETDALAGALARVALDASLRARLGEQGRAWVVPRFSVNRYVEAIVGVYDALLERRLGAGEASVA